MRFLLVTDRLSTRGGAEHYLLDLLEYLASQGHVLRLLAGNVKEQLVLPAEVEVIRGLGRAIPSSSRLGKLDAHLEWADRVIVQNVMNPVAMERLARRGTAVFIIQDHRVFCPGLGKTLPDGRFCSLPMSMEICPQCLPDRDYCRRTLDLTRARAAAMGLAPRVVLSKYMADELATAGHPSAELIPPGLDWTRLPRPESERHGFLLAGRLVSHKAPLLAVQAWKASGTSQPLRIAGEGSQLDAIRQAAEGAEGSLEVLGWLDSAALYNQLGRAIALLFPAHWQEPLGILGIEALAMATPVILSAEGGTVDWSEEGCVRIPGGDEVAMTRAMQILEADPVKTRSLGEQGRARVQSEFSGKRFRTRWAGVLGFPPPAC